MCKEILPQGIYNAIKFQISFTAYKNFVTFITMCIFQLQKAISHLII